MKQISMVLLDSQYLKMWCDGTSSILFTDVKAVPSTTSETSILCKQVSELSIKLRKEQKTDIYALINAQSIVEHREQGLGFLRHILEAQVRGKIKHQAIIMDGEFSADGSSNAQTSRPLIHADFVSALSYLNYLREKSVLTQLQ